jgi:neutral ceramidase
MSVTVFRPLAHAPRVSAGFRRVRVAATVLAWIASIAAAVAAEPAGRLRAGAAVADITPEIGGNGGGNIVGGFLPVEPKQVHDPLHARCLVLDDGATKLAIVVCDLLGFHRSVSDEARARIAARLGIPAANVLISATHTHSATSALADGGAGPGGLTYTSGAGPAPKLDPYQEKVVGGIVDGVARAVAALRPAEAGFGAVEAAEHVFNRRWYLKPGTMPPNPFGEIDMVKMNPAAGSADLLEPAGPVNPSVSFLSVREPGGRPIAVVASYGLHYVGGVPGGDVSADYFAMFSEEVVRLLNAAGEGPTPVAMMANGASGDINNISFREPRPGKPPYEQMRYVAHDVARRVAEAVPGVAHAASLPLGARLREVEVGYRVPTPEQLDWARRTLEGPEPAPGKADLPRIYAKRVQSMSGRPPRIRVPVQVLRIGGAVVGTMPCEVFCEIGDEFVRRSGGKPAVFISLAHGYLGYLPTPRQHRLGGYETWMGTSQLEPAASDILLAALVELSRELAPAAAPAEPPAPERVKAATVLPPGHVLELVAAEPAVVDPVAITFDERGRPYVAEYRDYPQGPPPGEPARSRIVRLDDADGDGLFEGSTVVAESVPFAQGLLAVRGGLLVTAAPDLLFLADDDGDGKADRRELVATGFAVGNPQLRAACPQLDIDNSVSITGGLSGGVIVKPGQAAAEGVSIARRDLRIDLARGTIAAATGFGQFGNSYDDFGHRFTASNRNPLIAIRLPAAVLGRNTLVDTGGGFEDAAPSGAASRVFPIAPTRATAASHTGTHTSACGLSVFRGDLLGAESRGDAFCCEPVSHLVTRRRIGRSAAGFTSDHVEPEGVDFLASRDEWFRPVFTATGPDGGLWIVDMCRGTVEHPDYMPPGLAATLDLRAGDRAGRIWRVRRRDLAPRPWKAPATAAEAVALFADENGWRRSTAQRLLVEGRFPDAEAAVRRGIDAAAGQFPHLHALWTLHGLDRLGEEDVLRAAASPHASVREAAARIAATWPEGAAANREADVPGAAFAGRIARRLVADADPGVRFAAVLAAATSDSPDAAEALAAAAVASPFDAWIARAVVAGAPGRAAPILARIAATPGFTAPAAADAGGAAAEAVVAEKLGMIEKLATTAAGPAGPETTADMRAALDLLARRAAADGTNAFDVAALAGLAARRPLAAVTAAGGTEEPATVAVAVATLLAAERGQPLAVRRGAVKLLGHASQAEGREAGRARAALAVLVGTHEPAELQGDAVAALVRSGSAEAIDAVIAGIAGLEPAARAAAVGAILDRRDAAARLLAAIERQDVAAAIVPLERRGALERSPDAAVREAAARIWQAAAGGFSSAETAALVTTVRGGGSVERGREVFARHCAACHRVAGAGMPVGPDLAEAADRPIERLVSDIVDPNRAVEPRWEATVIVTGEGTPLEGILESSGRDAVVLVRAGGERVTVPREEIETLRAGGRSLMPEGFGRLVPAADFADLVAFLRGGRPVPALVQR